MRARRLPFWVQVKFRVHYTRRDFPWVLDMRSSGTGYLHPVGPFIAPTVKLQRPNWRRRYIARCLGK